MLIFLVEYLLKAIIYQQYHNVRYEYFLYIYIYFWKATDIDPYAYKIRCLYIYVI